MLDENLVESLPLFDQLEAAGVSTLRFPLRWDQVERTEGQFEWSAYERVHQQLVWHGLQGLPVVVGCPEVWVERGEARRCPNGLAYPTGGGALNAFGRFVTEVFRHFSGLGDHIVAVEVWSEPNNRQGAYIADAEHFARMVATAGLYVASDNAHGVVRPGSEYRVVSGGLRVAAGGDWPVYLRALAAQSFPWSCGVHIFGPSSPGSAASYPRELAEQAAVSLAGVAEQTDADLYITATGAVSSGPIGESGQAEAMGQLLDTLAGNSRCKGMVIAPFSAQARNDLDDLSAASSLVRTDGSPKPVMEALARQ